MAPIERQPADSIGDNKMTGQQKRETLILTFGEFDAFWLGFAGGPFAEGVEITIDGDLEMVFLVGLPR